MTKVYFTNVTPLLDDGVFAEALKRVSLKRQEKVNRFKLRCDKNLCLGAGLIAEYALRDYLGDNSVFNIDYEKNGKPVVSNSKDIHISISHSGDIAVCTVSDLAVGCDIQVYDGFKNDICQRCFFKSEIDFIFFDAQSREKNFYRIWALKEAYVKMTGIGIMGFGKTEIQVNKKISVKYKGTEIPVSFFECDIPGYAAAICIGEETSSPIIENVNILNLLIN